MKTVTAFVGSPRRKHTHHAVRQFLDLLHASGDIESDIVSLGDCDVKACRGCCVCFNKGEEFCPSRHDDRDALIAKMLASDGVVFATPTYSFQVSGLMKDFLDRLGFVFHRPRFFGRTFTSLVAQGIYGGPKVVDYLDFVGAGLGFNVVKGSCVLTREPISAEQERKNGDVLAAHSGRFYRALCRERYPVPSLRNLMVFRMSRTAIRRLDDSYRDYRYWRDNGWFEADYFYPTRLGVPKKAAGAAFDFAASRLAT